MNYKILIIDDEVNICELLKLSLSKENYEIATAQSGRSGIAIFKSFKPDLVLLDIMLPDKDGTEICREIREFSPVPIIIISAKNAEFDKVSILELGADDFIVKPFSIKEIYSRIKAILRRTTIPIKESEIELDTIKFEYFEINIKKYELKIKNKVVETPPKELELLYYFASNANRVFTRDQLLDKVWGFDYYGNSRTVDVHVKRLREKLDGVSSQWYLKTIWGVGYKFEVVM
jgi:DNA-binding response OmpR family regulator